MKARYIAAISLAMLMALAVFVPVGAADASEIEMTYDAGEDAVIVSTAMPVVDMVPCGVVFTSSDMEIYDGGLVTSSQKESDGYHIPLAEGMDEGQYTLDITNAGKTVYSGEFTKTQTETFEVTIDEEIDNGTVTADPMSGVEGTIVTLTVTPDEGYVIDMVTVNGDEIFPVEEEYSFVLDGDAFVSAVFEPGAVEKYTATFNWNMGDAPKYELIAGDVITFAADDLVAEKFSGDLAELIVISTLDSDDVAIDVIGETYTFTMPAADIEIDVIWTVDVGDAAAAILTKNAGEIEIELVYEIDALEAEQAVIVLEDLNLDIYADDVTFFFVEKGVSVTFTEGKQIASAFIYVNAYDLIEYLAEGTVPADYEMAAIVATAGSAGLSVEAGSIEISGQAADLQIDQTDGEVVLIGLTVEDLTVDAGTEIKAKETKVNNNFVNNGVVEIKNAGDIQYDESKYSGEGEIVIDEQPGKVKLTKTAGVEYYLNEKLVSGTIDYKAGDILAIKVLFGFKATEKFEVLFDNVAVESQGNGEYKLVAGTQNVKVKGVEEIEWNEATITGKKQIVSCGAEDKMTVSGTLTVVDGANVIIYGMLYVPAGATLVIEQNAELYIYGQLLVEGQMYANEADVYDDANVNGLVFIGSLDNEDDYRVAQPELSIPGTADVAGDLSIWGTLTIDGTMLVEEEGSLMSMLGITTIGKGASLTMCGSMLTVMPIVVEGNLIIDTQDIGEAFDKVNIVTVYIRTTGTVQIDEFGGADEAALFIVDEDMNIVTITIDAGVAPESVATGEEGKILGIISGLIITDSSKTVKNKTNYTIDVAGDIKVTSMYVAAGSEDEPTTTASAVIAIEGANAVTIKTSLTVGEDVTLATAGSITVSGAVDMTADSKKVKLVNEGTITMSGVGVLQILGGSITNEGTFNAVKWSVDTDDKQKLWTYTTVDLAIAQMNSLGNDVKSFKAMGTQTVTKTATIPADIALDLTNATLNIGAAETTDVVLTVAKSDRSGLIKGNNATSVIVNGTLFAEKKTNLNEALRASIKSDVSSEELDEKGRAVNSGWQKWTNIYSALSEAEAGEVVELHQNVTLTKDLTVPDYVALESNGHAITVNEMKKLTVDGMLILENSAITLKGEGDKKALIEVNGMLASNGEDDLYGLYKIPGAYYKLERPDEGDIYNVVSPVSVVAPIAATVENSEITLKGEKLIFGDVAFEGVVETEYSDAIIPVVTIRSEDTVSGTITISEAMIVIPEGIKYTGKITDSVGTIDLAVMGGEGGATVYCVSDAKGVHDLTVTGEVANIAEKKITVEATGTLVMKGFTSPSAKISGTVKFVGTDGIRTLTVSGTAVVDNEARLNSDKATVSGNVTVADKTDKLSAGQFTVKVLYIGTTEKSVFGSAADVSGNVVLTDYAFADPGATVPEDFNNAEKYKSTQFIVENALYLIGYAPVGVEATKQISDVVASVDSAQFVQWMNGAVPVGAQKVGDIAKVTAAFKYDIYTVNIKSDAGIKEIKIGNIMMRSPAAGMNIFTLDGLVAGTYKVTYTLINGYSGDAVLTTEMGTIVQNNTITLEGLETIVYNFQLSGTEPTPEPEPVEPEKESEWTITTILLCILVVLIAIMAVIVALRLNRS